MAGLLDVFNSDEGRLGLGLLAAAGPRSDGAGFGQRLQEGIGSVDAWKQNKAKQAYLDMQMKQAQTQMEDSRAQAALQQAERERRAKIQQGMGQFFKPGQQALSPLMGDPSTGILPSQGREATAPSFDAGGAAAFLAQNGDYEKAIPMLQSLQPKERTLSPGQVVFSGNKKILEVPKEVNLPSAVQEYQFAVGQGYPGTFEQFSTSQKKAGATNISTKIENKMGDSLATQIGPMAKDSKIQAQGAVKMFDAAERMDKAIASGMVSAGPLSTQIQTVKQLVQKIGGGNDEGIRQTRQVIKSLAQMSVEARKQLQGQGQVTESEAAAVAKADAGDINDLTVGELKDLVTLTKRAAHYTAKSHNDILTEMGSGEATKGAAKFYGVQGMDGLLNYQPTLPQIGGSVRDKADAILGGGNGKR